MSNDFECLPVGTAARLAAAEARADRAEQCAETEAKRADKAEAERDALLEALERLLPAYRKAVKLYDPNTDDDLTVAAHNAIAKAKGGGNG